MIPYSVWNYKGGVGKSHTSLTLSGYLANQGKRVALVDYDPQNGAMICSDIAKANGSPLPYRYHSDYPRCSKPFNHYQECSRTGRNGQALYRHS
ncbi:Sporulation initiation inhibitor protein soj [Salmonella enterica subsp. enterica serovar Typhi]|nr:Sporulation initiation inhibitor protein soj [Salmonella enterica subsp. enterica serovar Typhi]